MSIDGIEVLERTYTDGKEYWQTVSPDIDGMLGGFQNLNIVDANDSKNILKKLIGEIRNSRKTGKLRALDCGAGIGRVTKHVLSEYFDEIDLLEQNEAFLAASKEYMGEAYGKVTNMIAQGIQQFEPREDVYYDCIWGQWVFGHITDQDLVRFFDKCYTCLNKPHGMIVIKDNITKTENSILDEVDSAVTRSHRAFLNIFTNLHKFELKHTFKLKWPQEMFPVKTYVLKLK